MLFLFASLVLVAVLLTGWGRLAGSALRIHPDNPCLWPALGFFAAATLGTLLSLAGPLDRSALAGFVALGVFGWLPRRRRTTPDHLIPPQSADAAPATARWFLPPVLAYGFLISGCLAFRDYRGFVYDTDLYHAQGVRWLNEFGTVPGLVNLHFRLAANTAWHVFAAVLDNGPWDHRTVWIMPALSFVFPFAYFLHAVWFDRDPGLRAFGLAMLPWLFDLRIGVTIAPGLDYDQPPMWLHAVVIAEGLRLLSADATAVRGQARLLLCLAAAGFMVKPTAGPTVLFASALAVWTLARHGQCRVRTMLSVFGPALAGAAAWMARNAVLSGYPLYPLPWLGLSASWSMGTEDLFACRRDVTDFARNPARDGGPIPPGWGWVGPWWRTYVGVESFWLYVILPLTAALPFWAAAVMGRARRAAVFFGLWAVSCIGYWFVLFPSLRFGQGLFRAFLALGFALAWMSWDRPAAWLDHWWRRRSTTCRRWVPVATLAGAVVLFVLAGVAVPLMDNDKSLLTVNAAEALPLRSRILDDSVTPPIRLYFPVEGDRTGNAPLPAAPDDCPGLRLRTPGRLSGGYAPRTPPVAETPPGP